MISRELILSYLDCNLPVYCHDSLPSTNDMAKELARQGTAQGTLVIAGTQTKGRGMRGRSFISPEGGLYMSLVVDGGGILPGLLTTLAAVAAVRAVRETSGHVLGIKWVNDLLLEGKKAGGILTEALTTDDGKMRQVIGIGINTGVSPYPGQYAGLSGPEEAYPRERLAALMTGHLLNGLAKIPGHMDEYRALCQTVGRQVNFVDGDEQKQGLAVGIGDDGALLVDTPDGLLRLTAGDVSVLPAE